MSATAPTNSALLSPEFPSSGFRWAFYPLCVIEMFERLAYFGIRAVVPIYIMQANEPGGLQLTAAHKGSIYAMWFIVQSILPMFTGGLADRFGFKNTLVFAISMNALGYVLMALFPSYAGFYFGVMTLATGTAFFKPGLQGSLAHSIDRRVSSLGWGIFYWIVNVGGLVAPFVATFVLGEPHSAESWRNLFLVCAAFTAVNLLLLFAFDDVPSGSDKTEPLLSVFARTIMNLLDPRLAAFLIIMSGFWLMMYQVWDLHPNFIEDWVDSSPVANSFGWLPASIREFLVEDSPTGPRVPQQLLLAVNAGLIILLIIPIAWIVRHFRTLSVMLVGTLMAVGGILVSGFTGNGWVFLAGICLFSLGEMLTGPKKNEYLGLIAPPGKKGLYLGYVNIPVGIGGAFGSLLAGQVYGRFGEKATLALRYLAEKTPFGQDKEWDGKISTLEGTLGVSRSEAMTKLQEVLNIDARAATQLLWETYDPQYIVWIPFAAIGVASAIALAIFGKMAKRWSDMNA